MRSTMRVIIIGGIIGLIALAAQGYFKAESGCRDGVCGLFEPAAAVAGQDADLPTGTEQITFVELGSVKCIPCKKMQPIMDEIEKDYAGKVKVVFHDVWTAEGKAYGEKYTIRLIPTQVFLNKEGNEIARHEGFFPKDEIVALLAEHGVTS